MNGQVDAPAALPPAKELRVTSGKNIGWIAERIWPYGTGDSLFLLVGNRTPAWSLYLLRSLIMVHISRHVLWGESMYNYIQLVNYTNVESGQTIYIF